MDKRRVDKCRAVHQRLRGMRCTALSLVHPPAGIEIHAPGALAMTPATSQSVRLLVRTADPTDRGLIVGSAARTNHARKNAVQGCPRQPRSRCIDNVRTSG